MARVSGNDYVSVLITHSIPVTFHLKISACCSQWINPFSYVSLLVSQDQHVNTDKKLYLSLLPSLHSNMGSDHITQLIFFFFFTCEESEGWLRLWSHDFYHAEEGESDSVVGPGKGLCISAHPRFCVSVLCTRESQHGEVSGPESPVQLLQVSVVLFSLFTVTRHVYNQRHLKPQYMVIQQCYNTVLLNSGSWLVRRCWSVFYNRSSDEIWWGNDCL